ncbi:MAG: hypothetical protein IPP40_05090 [bacterium]|nr:hypothetical protein [bacterium]
MKSTLSILAILLLLLFTVSCKNDGEKQSGVYGRVTAAEGSAANAVVSIYKTPDPAPTDDLSVWSVSNDNDGVGFPYGLNFTFDHRSLPGYQWVATDTADGDGNFRFESVVGGNYIVVASKLNQDFCFSLPKELNTAGSDVDLGEFRLPRVVVYENVYTLRTNTTWEAGTHYVIRDRSLRVMPGVTLTIEPGAIVLLSGGSSLEIDGTLICHGEPNNFIRFMAADVFARDPDSWQEIKIDNGANTPDIQYASFMDGATALKLEASGGSVRNCFFTRMSAEAILAQSPEPPSISRCVFDRVGNGLYNAGTAGFSCERSVFQTCDPFAIILYTISDAEIFCNWFRDCGGSDTSGSGSRGVIKLDLVTNTEIHNNFFETSWYALQIGSWVDSTTEIHHNVFTRMNTVMNIGVTEDQRGPSNPKLNYNCFSTIDRKVVFVNCNQFNYRNIDAANNSWGTMSINQIKDQYINDRDDDGTCPLVFIAPPLDNCNAVLTLTGTRAGICQ